MNDESVELLLAQAGEMARHSPSIVGDVMQEITRTDAVRDAARAESSIRPGWRTIKTVRRSAFAAGMILAATIAIVWFLAFRGANLAFAQVLEQVRAAHAVRCVATDDKGSHTEILLADPDWIVAKSQGSKIVMNRTSGKGLNLLTGEQRAIFFDNASMSVGSRQQLDILDRLKQVRAKDGKPLGAMEINGEKVEGFVVEDAVAQLEVWADAKTGRPVLIKGTFQTSVAAGRLKGGSFTFEQFDWNPKVEAGELSLDAPKGYKIENEPPAAATAGEMDVVGMLRQLEELNGGVFPNDLGLNSIFANANKTMQTKADIATKAMTPEQKQLYAQKAMDNMLHNLADISKGMKFMQGANRISDWRYAGKGVKFGEKGHIVLWYLPKGALAWRAFDADLTVHDAKESDLPKGEPTAPSPFTLGESTAASQPH